MNPWRSRSIHKGKWKALFCVELHLNGSERVCVSSSTHANEKAGGENTNWWLSVKES